MATATDGRLADLHTIMAVARALGSERDLDRLLDRILAAVTDLVQADRASLFLIDHDRHELWTSIAQGAGVGRITVALGEGIAGSVAASGRAINIPAAYDDPRFNPEHDQRSGYRTRAILAMPLTNHTDQVVGVIQVLNKRGNQPFSTYDEQLLSALCAQAGVAIDNAQLIGRDLERQRLARDMELARQIQLSLLPTAAPEGMGWRIASFSRSCDDTGGDYHDFLPRADGDGLDLVIGDVSGHGIGAALLMSSARASLRALHAFAPDPAALIGHLNRLLEADMADDAFMSLALVRLGRDGACRYVAAGHEAPLIWRNEGAACEEHPSGGLPLGMLAETGYDATVIAPLARGDLLIVMTDGIFEAQGAGGVCLGLDRVRSQIAHYAARGAQAVCDGVIAGVLAHLGGDNPHDDMTLVVAEKL